MEYQFIASGDEQIYSVYYEPLSLNDSETGVVLCYPIGQEYIRCHKLFGYLANSLSIQGFHVLRFDYSGTGDSSGDFSAVRLSRFQDDIKASINELKETCGLSKIILIGARFGATLAFLHSKISKIDGLVLWCPIVNGNSYLKELKMSYHEWLSGTFTKEKDRNNGSVVSFGFEYSSDFTKEIGQVSLGLDNISDKIPLLLLDEAQFTPKDIKDKIEFVNVVNKEFWLKRDNEMDKGMIPKPEIDIIVDWIKKL